jgi:MFS family permease
MNRTLFYSYSFIKGLVPIYPVYLLLFESKGFSLAQISLLLAIWTITPFLVEIPTGILADHWNRKNMLVIGGLLHAGCYVLWYFSEGFWLFALGFVLWGISGAFLSGSTEALLYDNLKKEGREESFDKIYGQAEFYTGISTGISMFLGGFLSQTLGMDSVLILSSLMSLFGTVLASLLPEANLFKENARAAHEKEEIKVMDTLKDGIGFLVGKWEHVILVVIAIAVVGTAEIIDEYDQLIAGSFGLSLTWVGIWGGGRYLLDALGSKLAYRFKGLLEKLGIKHPFSIIWVLSLASVLCLLLSGLWKNLWLMILYGCFYLVMSSCRILQEDYLQKKIDEQGRSTVHSMVSLLLNGYSTAVFGLLALAPQLGAFDIILVTALYMLAILFILGIIYSSLRNRGEA